MIKLQTTCIHCKWKVSLMAVNITYQALQADSSTVDQFLGAKLTTYAWHHKTVHWFSTSRV